MSKRTEELKQKMKEEYAKKVDEYFIRYEELKESGKFDINGIEELIGRGITATKEVLITTTEKIMTPEPDTETDAHSKKNNVPHAKSH